MLDASDLEDNDIEFILNNYNQSKLYKIIFNWLNSQPIWIITSILDGSNRVLIRNYFKS